MEKREPGLPQVTPHEPEHVGSRRDPEEREARLHHEVREKTLDKTLADSFPTSDPPSSIPDPGASHEHAEDASFDSKLISGLPPGSWAVISDQERRVVGTGPTRDEAMQSAGNYQEDQVRVVRVPQDPDAPQQAA
jgi:hypothetical protein